MTQALHQWSMAKRMPTPVAADNGKESLPDTAEELHAADRKAAAMVPGLMVSIFVAGMIMYITIALLALAGSP